MTSTPSPQRTLPPRSLLRAGTELAAGVWWVEHERVDAARARAILLDDFHVVPVRGASCTDVRAAQAAIAAGLHLPGRAASNLDALADTLRDLDLWWPRTRDIAILWSDADVLRDHDREGFDELVSILGEAHGQLWRDDRGEGEPLGEHERNLVTLMVPASDAGPLDPTDPSIQ